MQNPISPENLQAALQWRYATKRFDASRQLSPELWSALEQALILSPSSFGLQPWKFIVLTNPDVRKSLVPHTWGQTQPVDCSHFVVFAARTSVSPEYIDQYLARIVELRGGSMEALAGYRGMMVNSTSAWTPEATLNWATHQVYIALGQLMAAAAVLGVDACPMEGFVPAEYDKILGLEDSGFHSVVTCAVGYRASDDKYASLPKVRFSAADVIQHIR